jgi:hypothetical protein
VDIFRAFNTFKSIDGIDKKVETLSHTRRPIVMLKLTIFERKKDGNEHDLSRSLLFSNKVIFRQLLETFVKEPWVSEI